MSNACSSWIAVSDEPPPENEYILVWDNKRGLAMIAKWNRGKWFAVGNNIRKESGTHWARVVGPDGTHSCNPRFNKHTTRESQDT